MPFIGVTRLKLRSIRFLPPFAIAALRIVRQVGKAPGFLGGSLLTDRAWTFWTMTAWDSQETMRRFMTTGSHGAAMPRLLDWCDEASVVHWAEPGETLPSWPEADKRMRESGRPSKVRNPSLRHATLSYEPPRTARARPIQPARPS
jgi:hypothetical protein